MQNSRKRKIIAALPPLMHPIVVAKALRGVHNDTARAQLVSRYARREWSR